MHCVMSTSPDVYTFDLQSHCLQSCLRMLRSGCGESGSVHARKARILCVDRQGEVCVGYTGSDAMLYEAATTG